MEIAHGVGLVGDGGGGYARRRIGSSDGGDRHDETAAVVVIGGRRHRNDGLFLCEVKTVDRRNVDRRATIEIKTVEMIRNFQ